MPFSAGTYTLPNPALVTGEIVSASENNATRNDIAAAFNLTMLRNGTSTATANLPMGGYKLTGLGAATTNGDALSYGAAAVVTTLTSTTLTATRVPYASTGGLLTDASTFTFDGTTLTAGGFTTSGAVSAGTISASGNITVSGGTANGVAYLNGSKVLTTGSALTFNGSTVNLNNALNVLGSNFANISFTGSSVNTSGVYTGLDSGGGYVINVRDNGYQAFSVNNAEQMRLTSTGLGIGTSSPSTKLDIAGVGGSTPAAIFKAASGVGNAGGLGLYTAGTDANARNWYLVSNSNSYGDLVFRVGASQGADPTSGTAVVTFSSSGNLGLGVTPSAWTTFDKVFQFGAGAIANFGLNNNTMFGSNTYYNTGAFKYIASDYATNYRQIAGQHQWYTAPSGTAGNAITFTQAMTLDASGNLALGSSSAYRSISNYVFQTINGTNASGIDMGYGGSRKYSVVVDSGGVYLTNAANTPMTFGTNDTERMRIDSSGNLLVGTTGRVNASSRTAIHTSGASSIALETNVNSAVDYYPAIFYRNSTIAGYITTVSNTVSYATSSDYRLKENIQPMQNALGVVSQLNPVTYTWKADGSDGQGFIAHELQAVVPDCVTGEKDAVDAEGNPIYQGIDTSFLVATLCKAIQELEDRVKQLEGK